MSGILCALEHAGQVEMHGVNLYGFRDGGSQKYVVKCVIGV